MIATVSCRQLGIAESSNRRVITSPKPIVLMETTDNYLLTTKAEIRPDDVITIGATHTIYYTPTEAFRRRDERQILKRIIKEILIKEEPDETLLEATTGVDDQEGGEVIVGGDLNPFLVPLIKFDIEQLGLKNLIDQKTWDIHKDSPLNKIIPDWLVDRLGQRLDFVFGTPGVYPRLQPSVIYRIKKSDHYPVLIGMIEKDGDRPARLYNGPELGRSTLMFRILKALNKPQQTNPFVPKGK